MMNGDLIIPVVIIKFVLKSHSPAVPVVFSCQGGLTRTTVAIVIAAIIKEAQLEAEFTRLKGKIAIDASLSLIRLL